jgi:hypothetical protein
MTSKLREQQQLLDLSMYPIPRILHSFWRLQRQEEVEQTTAGGVVASLDALKSPGEMSINLSLRLIDIDMTSKSETNTSGNF